MPVTTKKKSMKKDDSLLPSGGLRPPKKVDDSLLPSGGLRPPKKVVMIRPKRPAKDPLLTRKPKKTKKPKKPETEYEKCRKVIINRYMKLFERGILKIRGNPVKSRKQAIAIALQIAAKGCESKMNRDDIQEMQKKVDRAIKVSLAKEGARPLRYTDILRIRKLLVYYQKKSIKSLRLVAFVRKYLASADDSIPDSHKKALQSIVKIYLSKKE